MGRADLHTHTVYSDGMMSPEMLVNLAAARDDLDVIAITDHDTMVGWHVAMDHLERFPELRGHVEVVPGIEVSTRDGHVLGLWVEREIPPRMSAAETVAAIHEQGGLAVAPHPFTFALRLLGLKGVGSLLSSVSFDAVEVRNSNLTEIGSNTFTRCYNRWRAGRPEVGGSDCHFLSVLGRTGTLFPGSTGADLRRAIAEGTTAPFGTAWTVHLLGYLRDRIRLRRLLAERGITLHFL